MSGTRHITGEPPFDAVIAVGSQGSLTAFQAMLGCLPPGFPATVVFDLHRSGGQRFTEDLLARRARLAVRPMPDDAPLLSATLYLAPWNRRVTVTRDRRLSLAARQHGASWPRDVDGLLTSAAQALGPRVIAVVLSGRLDGGARGICEIKRHGGRVLVQSPSTAAAPSMPNAALATGCADFALDPEAIGRALVALCASAGAAELFRVRLNAGVRG